MLRAGLLGAARIAPKAFIVPAKARGDIEIIAVGCRDTARGKDFITANDIPATAMSYENVCTHPDIDMIYCALPPSAHIEWVIMALAHGKAVLVEKPFSMNADESALMVEAALASGRPLMEAFHYCFHPAFIFATQKLRSGILGEIKSFEGAFTASIPNRNEQLRYRRELGGGALMDLGCYVLHALRQLIGEPNVVSASSVNENGVDAYLEAQLEVDGIPAKLMCDMREGTQGGNFIEIIGSQGALRFDDFTAPHRGHKIEITMDSKSEVFEVEGPVTYAAQLDEFVQYMHGNPPRLSGRDAICQSEAIDKIYALIKR